MKHFKTGLIAILTLFMMSLVLSACGSEEEVKEETVIEEEKPQKEEEKIKEDKEKPSDKEEPAKEADTDEKDMEVYKEFLEGKVAVSIKNEGFLEDGVYYLEEIIDSYAIKLGQNMLPDVISEAGYSYIDCGMDGHKELALKLFYKDTNEYGSPYTEYMILKSTESGFKLCASANTYYRSEATVNEYGYITEGGSTGADSAYFRSSFVDENGAEQWIYSDTFKMGLGELRIPQDYLSDSLSKKLSGNYSGEKGYYDLNCYLFENYELPDYNPDTWDSDYEGLVKTMIYVFEDDNGNILTPDKDYVSLCAQNGVVIMSKEEFDSALNEHYKAIGYNEEIQNGKDIEWTSFDVKDRVSINAQMQMFIDNSDMWYLDPSKQDEGSEVSYVITDLNRNGRYELIRSERLKKNPDNTEFCRNRFFEIKEDFEGIYKMDYEVENKWANGETSGWSHDLLSAQKGKLNCYWNPDFGSSDPDAGISYFYITPTKSVNQYGESECKTVFIANNTHKIGYGSSVGMADLTYGHYTDEGGLECSREEYDNAADISFPDDYWNHDEVFIIYVTLDEMSKDKWKEALTESASAYFYSTQYD